MKIVFMGTPDFAVPCLEALIAAGHDVAAVFTQPDKPVGRKQVLTPPAVKVCACEHGIPVYQPQSVKKDTAALDVIRTARPDIIVVVAYGKLLPPAILTAAPHGCINVHASLLPKYRGASPVQWAIVCGEKTTGVSVMQLDEGMDTGDILAQSACDIPSDMTADRLFERLSALGADLLIKTLGNIERGEIAPTPQDESLATYAPIITKEDGRIDFHKTADEIICLIRGLNVWPVAYAYSGDRRVKIYAADAVECSKAVPGEIVSQDKQILIQCGGNTALSVKELQLEGSKRVSVRDFLNGKTLESPLS